MVNHPWVDAADADNSLVCDVLLTLCEDSPPPPSPPPPTPPPQTQDAPATINPLDWSVRRRRSRPRIENRRVAAAFRSEAAGSSSSNGCRGSSTDAIARSADETGRGPVNLTGGSRSKATVAEPSGKTPTKKRKATSAEPSGKTPTKKRKQKETLKAFMEAHKKKNETRRVIKIKKKPTPPGEPQGPKVAAPQTPQVAESQGLNVAEPKQGQQVAPEPHQGQQVTPEPKQGHKVAEPQGPQVAPQQVAEPQGPKVAESQGPKVVLLAETQVLKVAESQGSKVVVLAETQGTEVVANGEIEGPEMVGAGGTEESIATGESQEKFDDHDAEEDKYVLPDLNIPYVDDTFP